MPACELTTSDEGSGSQNQERGIIDVATVSRISVIASQISLRCAHKLTIHTVLTLGVSTGFTLLGGGCCTGFTHPPPLLTSQPYGSSLQAGTGRKKTRTIMDTHDDPI